MALTEFTKDMNIISKLDDEPNDVGGLTSAELKAKFDEGGLALKAWLNETLLPALIAANLAFTATEDIDAETIQAAVEAVYSALSEALDAAKTDLTEDIDGVREDLQGAVMGSIPPTSVTYEKLASDVTNILNALQAGLETAQEDIERLDARQVVIDPVTQTENGLMLAADKVKLDGIAAQATRVLVDNALSETSTNAIQNKVVLEALRSLQTTLADVITNGLAGKANSQHTHVIGDVSGAQAALTFDDTPTENSDNPVKSGGIFEALKDVKTATQYTGTLLASGWAADSAGYQAQTITITGLVASYDVDPQWDVVLSGTDPAADAALLEGFAFIHNYTTGANSLTAQCIGNAPTVNIPVKVVVFG